MKKLLIIVFLIILCIPIVQPILSKGYFSMHDDTQIARVIVMGKAIRNGQFPVRWVSDLGYGYGYPLYNFYGPLPYYLGGSLYAAGLDGLRSTKAVMVLGMIIAAITMYVFVRMLFGDLSGIIAGLLYAYAPYHAVQLYVRGALGELWAYALLPLLFLGVYLYTDLNRRKHGGWIGGLGLAGIILSHTITGFVSVVFYGLGFVFYAAYVLITKRFHSSLITYHFSLLLVGLGLSAFFWIPAITEMGYTNVAGQIGATANFRNHFVCIGQLWNSLWGYGGSAPGCIDGMSFKIGKLHVVLGVLGVVLAALRLKKEFWIHPIGFMSIFGIGSAVMLLSVSQPVWEIIPGLAYVQYPWRFLTGLVFAASVFGGSILFWISRKWIRRGLAVIMIMGVIVVNAKVFVPQYVYDKPVESYEGEAELLWRVSGISDEYLPQSFVKPGNPSRVAREILSTQPLLGYRVETEINTETYVKLAVYTDNPIEVVLNRVYFPGWIYWVNGSVQTARETNGLPMVRIPSGRSVVELHFTNTPVRTAGNIISILVVLLFLRIYGKKIIA
ncbi:MAG: 6-pyruvoyl-tetrahydropterin synthase-related protein [Candidatus Gottesmanbacteria bacterium]|nr:6-pyruvoyl-tetrahydropterin synthase-related protein [Candidatus Gottesmanbacteria bacterium]